jgi:hypothetical protein
MQSKSVFSLGRCLRLCSVPFIETVSWPLAPGARSAFEPLLARDFVGRGIVLSTHAYRIEWPEL